MFRLRATVLISYSTRDLTNIFGVGTQTIVADKHFGSEHNRTAGSRGFNPRQTPPASSPPY